MDTPSNSMACSCHQNGGKKIHNYFVLETMLPVEYSYLICTFKESANHSITSRFHLNCFTKDEAIEWLDKCSSITNITFTIQKKDNTVYARCCCCTQIENRCRTVMKINLNPSNVTSNDSSLTEHTILHEHPTTVILHYTHDIGAISDMLIEEIAVDDDFHDSTENQPTTKPKSTFLDNIMRQKLSYLFDKGKSPQRTYQLYKNEIQSVFDRYNTDNSQQPDLNWLQEQFYVYFEHKYGIQFKEALTRWKARSEEQAAEQQSVLDTQKLKVLDSKIDELCKKYKSILPACEREPESSSPKVINSIGTSSVNNTPSYVINFNSQQPKLEQLNAIPVKLIPNDIVVQSKDSNHVLKMIGINESSPQNITLPSNVNGIFILAHNDIQPQTSFKQSNTYTSILKKPSSEKSPPPVPIPRKPKQPRKSTLKCEDPDDIMFTDKIEDLQTQVNSKKRKLKSSHSTTKKRKVAPKITQQLRVTSTSKKRKRKSSRFTRIKKRSAQQLPAKSTSKKNKRKSSRSTNKRRKVALKNEPIPTIDKNENENIELKNTPIVDVDVDDIENVICSD
ncbi:uncharacterized protein LOC135846359 [Planococcus citri]|uniref:uncharacterized protein LOC135846359 n=1 Tax=Planococcus citri TaxID=170843 RepID=UPI0031F910CD